MCPTENMHNVGMRMGFDDDGDLKKEIAVCALSE